MTGPNSTLSDPLGSSAGHDRALVVGQTSYGKGLVQGVYQLDGGYALKLTTGKWFTPSGRTIQRVAKSQEEQIAQVEREAEGTGRPVDDTSTQRFKSDDGRFLRGGGGIIPDVDIPKLKEIGVKGIFLPGTPMQEIVEFINTHARARV